MYKFYLQEQRIRIMSHFPKALKNDLILIGVLTKQCVGLLINVSKYLHT